MSSYRGSSYYFVGSSEFGCSSKSSDLDIICFSNEKIKKLGFYLQHALSKYFDSTFFIPKARVPIVSCTSTKEINFDISFNHTDVIFKTRFIKFH